jgi:hypothetical protein
MKSYQFPIQKKPHLATIKDKQRNSGLTSCRFYKEDLIIACDFNEHKTYLVEMGEDDIKIIDSHSTIINSGDSVETDLMDLRGDVFLVSNFYQGSISKYLVLDKRIKFIEEIDLSPEKKNMHGVRFIPGYEDIIWVAFCGVNNKSHEIWDIKKKEVLYRFDEDEQCQDIAFIKGLAIVFARTDHIWVSEKPKWWSKKNKMYATAYVYEIGNLFERSPSKISEWRGEGHIDAAMEYDGAIYAANQYLDRIDVFEIDSNNKLKLLRSIPGYKMPHGLDIKSGVLIVTNYDDQSLRVGDCK